VPVSFAPSLVCLPLLTLVQFMAGDATANGAQDPVVGEMAGGCAGNAATDATNCLGRCNLGAADHACHSAEK